MTFDWETERIVIVIAAAWVYVVEFYIHVCFYRFIMANGDKFCLSWNETSIVQILENLWMDKDLFDVTIACDGN